MYLMCIQHRLIAETRSQADTDLDAANEQMVCDLPLSVVVVVLLFAVQGPMVWNSLLDNLRAQQNYESFRQRLKTWLFSSY